MSNPDFVAWALAPERTVEEQYLVELMVERAAEIARTKAGEPYEPYEVRNARRRARSLNPAYRPTLTSEGVAQAEASLREATNFSLYDSHDRPVRSLEALRFFPNLEDLSFSNLEVSDVEALADLPVLEKLSLTVVERADLRALERCPQLVSLRLWTRTAWPVMPRLEGFTRLETFGFSGNLLVCESAVELPSLKQLDLSSWCSTPLRDARRLPRAPNVKGIKIHGLYNLDGIEIYASARTVSVEGAFISLEPLTHFRDMTHLELRGEEQWSVRELVRCPELRRLKVWTQVPRDYSALVEAPSMRELEVSPCTVDADEVAQLNGLFDGWGLDFIKEDAAQIAREKPFYVVVLEGGRSPSALKLRNDNLSPEMQKSFENWMATYLIRQLGPLLHPDDFREMKERAHFQFIELQHPESVDHLDELVREIQWCLRTVKVDQFVFLNLDLDPSAALEREQERAFRGPKNYEEMERRDQEELRKKWADLKAFKEREYRMRLREESGLEVNPEDFAPPDTPKSEGVPVAASAPMGSDEPEKSLHHFSRFCLKITPRDVRIRAKEQAVVEYYLGRPVDAVETVGEDAEAAE